MDFPEFEVPVDYKALAQRYKAERDAARKEAKELGKQLAAAIKRIGTEESIATCFGVFHP